MAVINILQGSMVDDIHSDLGRIVRDLVHSRLRQWISGKRLQMPNGMPPCAFLVEANREWR